MARYTHVIWDWNGTLFDDFAVSVELINAMLDARGLVKLDESSYRHVFGFPIEEYYARIGFDFEKEPFEKLAEEYVSRYIPASETAGLMRGAEQTLAALGGHGVRQVLLSATKRDILLDMVRHFPIESAFEEILGIDTIQAAGKVELAKQWKSGKPDSRPVCIGDTVHDAQVARALQCDCILIPNGHHARARLEGCGAVVLDDITGVVKAVLGE